MELTEIRSVMAEIVDRQVNEPGGVHWVRVRDDFVAHHPDVIDELGEQLAWGRLGTLAENAIKPLRNRSAQLQIPGLELTSATVTVPDAEGGFMVKSLTWATAGDLDADALIHDENVTAAIAARRAAHRRNHVLIPLMEAHGFATAGEAIEFLAGQA